MSLSDCTGPHFDDPTQPRLQNATLNGAAAAEVHGPRVCLALSTWML